MKRFFQTIAILLVMLLLILGSTYLLNIFNFERSMALLALLLCIVGISIYKNLP